MEERGKNGDNTTFDNDEVQGHRHMMGRCGVNSEKGGREGQQGGA
jgi:hypothetical protein